MLAFLCIVNIIKLYISAERGLFMKLFVWGTGCGAAEAMEKGLCPSHISAFIDSTPLKGTFLDLPVLTPDQAASMNPDLILVTCRQADQVAQQCCEMGIPADKILYLKEHCRIQDRNAPCLKAEKWLGKELIAKLLPKQYLVTCPDSLAATKLSLENDYVRLGVLELLSRRLENVPGDLAELGVYRGNFAACMNQLMPERTLYLFDSFQGFAAQEGEQEKSGGTCTDAFLKAHKNTNAEAVLSRMPHPQSVRIKAGFFPGSLGGLETCFCLVSLDADFYETTLEGLRYFWPRLSEGGYLMLHDWGSSRLKGVREALRQYEQELGHRLPSVPIPDIGNSIILQKANY